MGQRGRLGRSSHTGDHHSQLVNLYEPALDPFWAVCSELQMPVHRHSIMVSPAAGPKSGAGAPLVGLHEAYWFAHRGLSHLIFGGVFQRHPELKFVFTETACYWVQPELQAIEALWRSGLQRDSSAYAFAHRAASSSI